MIADILTKGLPLDQFKRLRDMAGVKDQKTPACEVRRSVENTLAQTVITTEYLIN